MIKRVAYLFLLVIVLFVSFPFSAIASTQPLPTNLYQSINGGKVSSAVVPNFQQINLKNIGQVIGSGSIDDRFNQSLGYDFSRTWQSGDSPSQFLKLGDIAPAMSTQEFPIGQIEMISGLDLGQIALDNFPLLADQAIRELAEAVPYLKGFTVEEVLPIKDLVSSLSLPGGSRDVLNMEIGQVIEQFPAVADLKLEQANLGQYAITDIPNVRNTKLGDLQRWEGSTVETVPGLDQVPLAKMPNSVGLVGNTVARIDQVFGPAEGGQKQTVSGSNEEGFSVKCRDNCSHIELDDTEDTGEKVQGEFEGAEWISGKYQEVNGGFGVLGNLNGGVEPTGRHPFGDAFKVVVWEADETSDNVSTRMYFRICKRGIPDLGCSPYFIPAPFLRFRRDDTIFMGRLDGFQGGGESRKVHGSEKQALQARSFLTQQPKGSSGKSLASAGQAPQRPCSGQESAGLSMDGLGDAIAAIESQGSGGYRAVGTPTCADKGKNCGVALGAYQIMSYDRSVKNQVAQVSGGKQWLKEVAAGDEPTQAEMAKFFPPAAQDEAFRNKMNRNIKDALQETDPRTGKKFQPGTPRLVERVSQQWFGGSGSKVDAGYSDALGSLNLYEYGVETRQYYNGTGGSPSCDIGEGSKSVTNTADATPDDPVGEKGVVTGKLINPASGYTVADDFGRQTRVCSGCSSFHPGVSIDTPTGTQIKAADGGQVIGAESWGGYGQTVVVAHGDGTKTRYSHLGNIEVSVGDEIGKGQLLGTSGSSGNTKQPQLDFGVYEYQGDNWRTPQSAAVDPNRLID